MGGIINQQAIRGLIESIAVTTPLGELHKSCCTTLQTSVIDFDSFTSQYNSNKGKPSCSSCDALIVWENKEVIDFVEMKDLEKTFNNPSPNAINEALANIKRFVEKLPDGVDNKLTDSLNTFSGHCDDALNQKQSELLKNHIPKRFILLIPDISKTSTAFITDSRLRISLDKKLTATVTELKTIAKNMEESNRYNCSGYFLHNCESLEREYNSYS